MNGSGIILARFKRIVIDSGDPWLLSAMTSPDPNKRDIAYLDQYSQERWNTVLHYMVRLVSFTLKCQDCSLFFFQVGSSRKDGVSVDAVSILCNSGLIILNSAANAMSAPPMVTRAGFQVRIASSMALVA